MSEVNQTLLVKAVEVIGNEQDALHWLKTTKRSLGDQIPFKVADTKDGKQKVIDLLGRIEHGVFS